MSELLRECPFCGSEAICETVGHREICGVLCSNEACFLVNGTTNLFTSKEQAIEAWNTRYSKYPLNVTKRGYGGLAAALSPTLDRLLDSLDEPIPCPACGAKGVIICEDGAWNCSDCNGGGAVGITPEAEADLGIIEHKGEKVTVKIKVARGE